MVNFSIDNDRNTLIPFIKTAKLHLPDIRIWASPWSPPFWMKYNKHYASRSAVPMIRRTVEHNITKYLKSGKSTLVVHVVKYSDGYYLEEQDY